MPSIRTKLIKFDPLVEKRIKDTTTPNKATLINQGLLNASLNFATLKLRKLSLLSLTKNKNTNATSPITALVNHIPG